MLREERNTTQHNTRGKKRMVEQDGMVELSDPMIPTSIGSVSQSLIRHSNFRLQRKHKSIIMKVSNKAIPATRGGGGPPSTPCVNLCFERRRGLRTSSSSPRNPYMTPA